MSKPPQFNRPSGTLPQRASINDLLADGLRLHQSGKRPDAARLYEQVLAREPEQPAANHLLGLVRLQQGRPDEAVRLIGRATKANKTDAQYFANLGVALNAAGRPAEAVGALDRAIALKPAFPAAHSNRGMALKALGRLDEAAASYREAIALLPAEAGFHFNLGNTLNDAGDLDAAEAAYREALRLRPVYPAAISGLSSVLEEQGRAEEAVGTISAALKQAPNEPECHYRLGRALYQFGRLDDALAAYRRALALRPAYGEAQFHLAHMIRHSAADAELAAMTALFGDPAAPLEDRIYAGFGLGKALADLGEHAESITAYESANALRRPRLDVSLAAAEAEFSFVSGMFRGVPESMLAGGYRDEAPIFVVGLPRSGKSTIEAILALHTDVHAGGELRLLSQLVDRSGLGQAANAADIAPQRFVDLGADYARHIRELAPGGKRVTDTMPPNFRLIGLIRAALPEARIIHCVRDPAEHCIAIFEKYLTRGGYDYAADLAELAAYHRAYRQLMADWHALFPGFIHDVNVSALSADRTTGVRELLHFAGLSWHPACLTATESEPQMGEWSSDRRAENRSAHLAEWKRLHPELWS